MSVSVHPAASARVRFKRVARRLAAAVAVGALSLQMASAQTTAEPPMRSPMDAALFYQLLIGEMQLSGGAPGAAFEIVLDAARKARSEQLFQRAADIALSARAGDQALTAARSWRAALPESIEAHRYLVQLLVALNRPGETLEPIRSLINLTPAAERGAVIASLPRFFARGSDKQMSARLVEQILEPYAQPGASRTIARVAIARAWLAADDTTRAYALATDTAANDPNAEEPAFLAMELMGRVPDAEKLVLAHLATAASVQPAVRLVYAQVLTSAQRYADAIRQLEVVTKQAPELSAPWLTLGALHVELRHPAEAQAALETYLRRAQAETPAPGADGSQAAAQAAIGAERLTEAWLLLAQVAEQKKDFAAAEAWLARVDDPQRESSVQQRRASLLGRQGKVDEARALIRSWPAKDDAAVLAKTFAEAQLLRDAKQWTEAKAVLQTGIQRFPEDVGLLYEQAMLFEKLDRLDDMERLLRRVIALRPDHQHAHNALGYSLAERKIRLPEAKALIERALELAPGDPFITDSLGWVEYRLGNRVESIRLLRKAYQSRPDAEIGAHLGEVLWVSGQRDEARLIWREARGRDAGNEVLKETLTRLKADL